MAQRQHNIVKGPRSAKAGGSSLVWQYFRFVRDHPEDPEDSAGHVVCNMCSRKLTFKQRSTGTMWNHLRFLHSEHFAKLTKQTGSKYASSSPGMTKGHHHPNSLSRTQQLTRAVGFHLAKSLLPPLTVEEASFSRMLKEFDPKYQLPSAKTFSTSNLPALHSLVKSRVVMPALSRAEFVALSVEAWSTYAGDQLMTVNAHILNQEWELMVFNLDTLPWVPTCSDSQFDQIVKECMDSWAVPINKLSAVTGNVSLQKAGTVGWVHIPCLRQALSSMVQAGMEEEALTALRSKCQGLPEASESVCSGSSLEPGQSGWEKLCDTFTHVLEQETSGGKLQLAADPAGQFSAEETQIMEDFVEILQPLKELSAELGGEQAANSAAAILPSFALMKTILCPLEADSSSIAVIKCVMFTKMRECFDSQTLTDLLARVCFLDPRFKTLPFMSEEERAKVRMDLVREVKEMFPPEAAPESGGDLKQPRRKKRKSLAQLFQTIIPQSDAPSTSSEGSGGSAIEREFSKYSAEEDVLLSSDPLEWWAANALRFPSLQHLARKYLCIPASILAYNRCPRRISRRACLSTPDAGRLLFLHDNMPDDFLDSGAPFDIQQPQESWAPRAEQSPLKSEEA